MQTRYEQFKLPIAGFSLKKLNYLETHRGVAYSCEVYVDKRLVGILENRGDGGCTSFYPILEQRQYLQEFVAKNDIKSIMVNQKIGGHTSVDQIRDIDAMEHLVEAEIDRVEFNKALKKKRQSAIFRLIACNASLSNIFWTPPASASGMKRVMQQMSDTPFLKSMLQARYDEICDKITGPEYAGKEPFFFVNTPDQLTEIGIKVKPELHWPVS